VLAFAGSAMAGMPAWWTTNDCVIHYDGLLVMTIDPASGNKSITVDTLIAVTNTSLGASINVAIDVFDKNGSL